ncbi:MAG: hypothetical protein NTX04_07910 [Verrucomicrobia bacterium]|nr:hypothetical protein [Verrucomicrobiota bacterium]
MQQDTINTFTSNFPTDCRDQSLLFADLGARKVMVDFSGGYWSSDGGALILRQIDSGLGSHLSLGLSASVTGVMGDLSNIL